MMRFLARILIQKYRDDCPKAGRDPLPGWLRRWVDSDISLKQYDDELLELEKQLSAAMSGYLASSRVPQFVAVKSWTTRPAQDSDIRLRLALAAGLLCVLACAGRSVMQETRDDDRRLSHQSVRPEPTRVAEHEPNQHDSQQLQSMVDGTYVATQRLAMQLQNKTARVHQSWAQMQRALVNEQREAITRSSRAGIAFVVQELPAATVRMLGLVDQK
jgi:hypothetical protein